MGNQKYNQGQLLEEEVQEKFTNLGWDVSLGERVIDGTNNKVFCPDLTLSYNNKLYGYVEVKTNFNPTIIDKLLDEIDYIVKTLKVKVFILSNGYSFDVYINGISKGNMTIPPSPEDIDILLSDN